LPQIPFKTPSKTSKQIFPGNPGQCRVVVVSSIFG
jgi:hypothetical protein